MATRTEQAGATELYFEQKGDGVPILLIPAAGCTASTWGVAGDGLARIGRVITYDRRGYARSGGEPVNAIRTHATDAAALLDELQMPPAVVVGISVGATIAIDLARLRPDLVRAVVAHESPWHVRRHAPTLAQLRALTAMSRLAARGRHAEAAATFLRFAYTYRDGGSAWDAFPQEWRDAGTENARAALADIRIAVGAYPSAKELRRITTPVLCTCGERSSDTIVRVTRKLARVIPTATFHQIPHAGHAAPFDAPADFLDVVRGVMG
jgi:pimeloyl-ACP methyl ester carboxylesterase